MTRIPGDDFAIERRLADLVEIVEIQLGVPVASSIRIRRLGLRKPLRARLPADFHLLPGDDGTAAAYLTSGGDGCVSNLSNIAPDHYRSVYQYCRQADPANARTLAAHLAPLGAAVLPDATLATLKYALCLLGLEALSVRLPLVEIDRPAKVLRYCWL